MPGQDATLPLFSPGAHRRICICVIGRSAGLRERGLNTLNYSYRMNRAIQLKLPALLLLAILALPAEIAAERGAERLKSRPPPKPAAKAEVKKSDAAKGDEEKSFDEVVKDMEVIKGLFTFYRKSEDNRILMEILPEQLDRTFLCAATVDQSVGERGLYAAQMGGSFPFNFRKLGKNIQWIIKNPTFTARNGTPAARATARSWRRPATRSCRRTRTA